MPPPIALIQLISEQTMQNLMPLLALKPAKVFRLTTPKTLNPAQGRPQTSPI